MRVSLNLKETDLGFFSSLGPSKDSSLMGPAGEGVDVRLTSDHWGSVEDPWWEIGKEEGRATVLRVLASGRNNTKCPRTVFRTPSM